MKRSLVFFVLFITFYSNLFAKQDLNPEQLNFFETRVRPLLTEKCLECHSNEKGKVKGGLSLDSREEILKGGENGEVFNKDAISKSLLLKAVNWDGDLQMPEKKKLTTEQIGILTQWFEMGIPDPREVGDKTLKNTKKKDYWSFQPVVKPKIPFVKMESWCYNNIDRFILSKLEEKEIIPAVTAHKETLIRRAYFDLIGLPPTPKQTAEFVVDESSNAFEKVIDKLLADPGYGERWGRHWLDTARYSDTTGELNNRVKDYRYSYAWSYRDWVINSLNNDMPYDQFLKNQLAADKLPDNSIANLAALGFLTVGQRFNNMDDEINDRIDVVGRGMLGLTLSCARCHDHKFDPITAADYYALRGIFLSCIEPSEGPIISGDPNSPKYKEFTTKIKEYEQKSYQAYYTIVREHGDKIRKNAEAMAEFTMVSGKNPTVEQREKASAIASKNKLKEREITDNFGRRFKPNDSLLGPFAKMHNDKSTIEQVLIDKKQKYSPLVLDFLKKQQTTPTSDIEIAKLIGSFFAELETLTASVFAQIMNSETKLEDLTFNKDQADAIVFPFELNLISDLSIEKLKQIAAKFPMQQQGELTNKTFINQINELKLTFKGGPVRAMVIEDKPKPVNSPLFVRGNAPKAGEEIKMVPRKFIEVLNTDNISEFSKNESGRLELAEAIANKNNPLTARVMVNRVWMYHFGEGLVRTPDDLGNQSGAPSHPELLDFLSNWFMEDYGTKKPGWSLKALHKAIMLSKTYQQSSNTFSKTQLDQYSKIDPSNSLLWHANVRRLDFESYRDSLLSMGKVLQRDVIGGPSFSVLEEPFIFRRTTYAYIDRANMPDVMMQFDMSNPTEPNTKRTSTIVPQQALFLMNSPLVASIVQNISHRSEMIDAVKLEKNTDKGIVTAFRIVLQRTPTLSERKSALDFLLKESKEQEGIKEVMKTLTKEAQKKAEDKYKQSLNNNNARKAIVNKGQVTERVTFSPWEVLIQSLIFTNEAAYVN